MDTKEESKGLLLRTYTFRGGFLPGSDNIQAKQACQSKTNNGLNRIAELSCFGGIGSRENRTRDIFAQGEILSWNEVPHEFSF